MERRYEGWGWNRSVVLQNPVPPAAYLDKLADAAEEWFKQRPNDPMSLAQRNGEFRQGCPKLSLTEHSSLAPDDNQ